MGVSPERLKRRLGDAPDGKATKEPFGTETKQTNDTMIEGRKGDLACFRGEIKVPDLTTAK